MKRLLFLFAIMVFTLSCSEKDPVNNEEKNEKGILEVNCFFTKEGNPNVLIPDAQSKVFIYFGYWSADFVGCSYCSYLGEGKIAKRDSVILPDQYAVIGEDGKVTIRLEQIDKFYTFLIESNYYKRITTYSYSESQAQGEMGKMICTVTFNP